MQGDVQYVRLSVRYARAERRMQG